MYTENQRKILEELAEQSDLLFSKGVIRTDSFTGEIGEYFVSTHFRLVKENRSTRSVDARDVNNKAYQIKAKVTNNDSYSFSINKLNVSEIDFLCVIYFDELYTPKRIIKIESQYLPGAKFAIPSSFPNNTSFEETKGEQINISEDIRNEVKKFGEIFSLLKKEGVVKSRRIVGDVGEFYACDKLNLSQPSNKNHKGWDAVDKNNMTYEIKTRRVYQSERRKSKTWRVNGLVGKKADFLVLVILDKAFRCNGMWKMPLANIINPKSANLSSIIKNTEGIVEIVPTNLDWLKK